MTRPIQQEDFPYIINPWSIRGVYGDGNPWVRWAMERDPEAVKYAATTALPYRQKPVTPRRKKARR